jgi:hypothetical protein
VCHSCQRISCGPSTGFTSRIKKREYESDDFEGLRGYPRGLKLSEMHFVLLLCITAPDSQSVLKVFVAAISSRIKNNRIMVASHSFLKYVSIGS